MPGLSANLGLPRKVVAYYLLFSVLAVAWLTVGLFFVAHAVQESESIGISLARLDKLTASIELDYLRNGEKNFQSLAERACIEADLRYCAIVSIEGKVLAHSNSSEIGKFLGETTQQTRVRSGSLSGVQYTDESGATVREYRLPLTSRGTPFARLYIGLTEPTIASTLLHVGPIAPLAILVPLLVIALGALWLRRLAKPLADVVHQLEQLAILPLGDDEEILEIESTNATSIGWNRVAQLVARLRTRAALASSDELLKRAAGQMENNQHKQILQNLSDGVALLDPEGRITFANDAVSALLGDTIDEQKTVDDLLRTLDANSQSQFDPRKSYRPVICEAHLNDDSIERILRISRQPLADKTGNGHLVCVRDITQQKLVEKMRDQFIDTATHELRTPLANIKAYAETLVTCESIDIEEQKEFCNIINSEVTRLARFVDDLLSISSMEMGSLVIDRQKVETERLFAEVLEKVEPLMQKKKLAFEVDLPEKMPEIRIDKDKMVAVLVNLLGNAAKYTPVGGKVMLHVNANPQVLEFSVADTGVGIAAEELPKVFDKFFRSNDPRVREETGTGLGLSLAQEVVRMHGGAITVESELDKGTAFHVAIPLEGGA